MSAIRFYCDEDSQNRARETARSIVVSEQGPSVGERLRRLLKLNDARTAEEMRGRLEYLSNWA